jgi:hypothetical protein
MTTDANKPAMWRDVRMLPTLSRDRRWRPRRPPIARFPDVVGDLEAHISLDGRKATEYLLYPRWERTIGTERVVYRADKLQPLSPRGMHESWVKLFHRASKDLKKT